jgi:NAD(P)-dependent dehydrogenase (short-subunit alcohol dehydrogenase family)
VSVSSAGHQRSPVVFDDIHFHHRAYDPFLAYGQSKTANVLFAVEASNRWADERILTNALMPGRCDDRRRCGRGAQPLRRAEDGPGAGCPAVKTSHGRHHNKAQQRRYCSPRPPLLDSIAGRYFEDCNEAGPNLPGTRTGVAAYAIDPEAAARLWQVSIDTLS